MLYRLPGILKAKIRKLLLSLGYKLVRVGGPLDRCTMDGAFRALVRRKHAFPRPAVHTA